MSSLQDIIESFEFLEDWDERYRFIIDYGRSLEPLPATEQTEENRVDGCVSQVWLVARPDADAPGQFHFLADSDAHITKGLVAILVTAFNGMDREGILGFDEKALFQRLGLDVHLSPLRSNGLHAMVRRIKALAAA